MRHILEIGSLLFCSLLCIAGMTVAGFLVGLSLWKLLTLSKFADILVLGLVAVLMIGTKR